MKEYKHQVEPKLNSNQFAYRNGLGTVDAIASMLEQWTSEIDKKPGMKIQVIFKDFSKAFDGMQATHHLLALENINMFEDIIHLAIDFLTDRNLCVTIV